MKYIKTYKIFESMEEMNDCFAELYDMGFGAVEDISKQEADRLKDVNREKFLNIKIPDKTFKLVSNNNNFGYGGSMDNEFRLGNYPIPRNIYLNGTSSEPSKRRDLTSSELELSSEVVDCISKLHNLYMSEYKSGEYYILLSADSDRYLGQPYSKNMIRVVIKFFK